METNNFLSQSSRVFELSSLHLHTSFINTSPLQPSYTQNFNSSTSAIFFPSCEMGLSGSYIRIIVLTWPNIIATYALWLLMIYLTDVWKMKFTNAAAVVNIFHGVATILQIPLYYIVDTLISYYWMVLFSSTAYCIGLGFLSMSTPPVLSKATGTCSAYEPDCVGDVQVVLFYAALALLAIGIAGIFIQSPFSVEQFPPRVPTDMAEEIRISNYERIGVCARFIFPLIGGIALPHIKPWSLRFGIPAICFVVGTLVFVSGSRSYIYGKPVESSLTHVFRVFVASFLKRKVPHPNDVDQLYEKRDRNDRLLPHTPGFRCLDKAAIVKPWQPLAEQENNRWKLSRVTEVEEAKITVRMIPMWIPFIVLGLVLSLGKTFFVEQANHMNPKMGKWEVPIPILIIFLELARKPALYLFYLLVRFALPTESRTRGLDIRYVPKLEIAFGLLMSVLCCITAAKVEERRIGVIKEHGLLDKPDDTVPMSMFWLLPQFLLLGGIEGLVHDSVVLLVYPIPSLLKDYMLLFIDCALGAGTIGGVLSVYLVGKASEGGGSSWFGNTLNKSRLDNYYWTLAVLSSINLVAYVVFSVWYSYRGTAVQWEDAMEEEGRIDYELMTCCCC